MKKVISCLLILIINVFFVCGCENDLQKGNKNNHNVLDDYPLYLDKINEYKNAMLLSDESFEYEYDNGYDYSSINARIVNYRRQNGEILYALYDIDNDEILELVFSDSYSIIDVYTIHNEKLIKIFENCSYGDRSYIHILSDGKILCEGSNGASAASCDVYKIDSTTGMLTLPIESYYCDGLSGKDPFITESVYISEKEYYEKIEVWKNNSIFDELKWTEVIDNSKLEQDKLEENNYEAYPENNINNSIPITFSTINTSASDFLEQLYYEKISYLAWDDCSFNGYVGNIDEEIYNVEFYGNEKYYRYGYFVITERENTIIAKACDSFKIWGNKNTYQLLKQIGLEELLNYEPEMIDKDTTENQNDVYLKWEGENGYLVIYTIWYDGLTKDWKDSMALNYCIFAK